MVDDAAPVILEAEHLSKRFGAVTALTDVSLRLHRGEVLGLVGDNGAGKSTLIKILCGFHKPDSGTYLFDGKPVHLSSPLEARALGIQTVYQDLALVNLMSITRNFFLGRELVQKFGPINWLRRKEMNNQTLQSLAEIGIAIRSPVEKVGSLSGGERQSIAIGRALHFGAKLLILDEPTSALSVAETRKVLNYITSARERGLAVIFITHNVHHVYQVADAYTIIRHGRKVGTYAKGDLTENDIADLITGDREY